MVLEADPAGKGFLPMGCLNHEGYRMEDPKDFYQNMILEVVSNKFNHSTWHRSDLKRVANMTGRLGTRTFNPIARNAINQHSGINVMYSKADYARGKVSRVSKLHVDSSDATFWEAHANAENGEVRPKFIAVPLPKRDEEARYVWIDLSWPIRSILLPVAQNPYDDGMQPHCTYVQLNFRRLKGKLATGLATDGFYEDQNRKFVPWHGDDKLGLYWPWTEASMRVDIDMMYGTLLVPRELREISDDLDCIQLHGWTNVPYDWNSKDKNLNYWVDCRERCINDDGLTLDRFLSKLHAVGLEYSPRKPSKLAAIVDTAVQFGLGFVPIVGPLLAYISSEIINLIEDPTRYSTEEKLNEKLGEGSVKPLLESLVHYGKFFVKKRSFMSSIRIKSSLFSIAAPLSTTGAPIATERARNSPTETRIPLTGESVPTNESQMWFEPGLDLKFDEKSTVFGESESVGLMPLFAADLEEFHQHPEAFAWEVPNDLPVLKKDLEEEKAEEASRPVVKKDSEADEEDEAKLSHAVIADHLEKFQQHPEAFAWEVPADLPVLKKDLEEEKAEEASRPVVKKDSEAQGEDEAKLSHGVVADHLAKFQQHPEAFAREVPADLPVLKKDLEEEKADEAATPVVKEDSEADQEAKAKSTITSTHL